MFLVVVIPLAVFLGFVMLAIYDRDALMVAIGVISASSAFLIILAIALTASEVRGANFVVVEEHPIVQLNGEFARGYLDDGAVTIEFAYTDENGVAQVLHVKSGEVLITVDGNTKAMVFVERNKNGTWYALNEDSLRYRITIPRFDTDMAIPVVAK